MPGSTNPISAKPLARTAIAVEGAFAFTEIRKKGCRQMIIDGKRVDLSEELSLEASDVTDMDAVVDRTIVGHKHEKALKAAVAATLLVGDGLMQVQVVKGASKVDAGRFY